MLTAAVPAVAAAVGVELTNPIAVALRSTAASDDRPAGCAAPCDPRPAAAAAASAASESTPSAASGAAGHGDVVSTVSACAPRGRDPLFRLTGDLRTHGDFVAAAAAGDTLALPFGSYDLATAAGAESLCAALAAQRAAMTPATPEPKRTRTAQPDRTRPPRESAAASPRSKRSPAAAPSSRAQRPGSTAGPAARPRPSKTR